MKIDEIIPYERNARNNAKAVPVVAESIKEFGLHGQIVLESKDNPVIVCGHTRWAACKSLGWTEIPDERIDYCDGLTEEQIKAYRLADNRTGEIATWKSALVQSEMKQLNKLDMSKFKFDFKSKNLETGAERLRTDKSYNLGIVNKFDCDQFGMPTLKPSHDTPNQLMAFSDAMSATDHDYWLHFFVDDYRFERLWNTPDKYLPLLKKFNGVLSPDFSLYMDMPLPMQIWNEYRRRALQHYWQRNGIKVIPTLSWTDEQSYDFCFKGIPKYSTVFVSTVGVLRDERALHVWKSGMAAALKEIKPDKVLIYGETIDFDFGKTKIQTFKTNTFRSTKEG